MFTPDRLMLQSPKICSFKKKSEALRCRNAGLDVLYIISEHMVFPVIKANIRGNRAGLEWVSGFIGSQTDERLHGNGIMSARWWTRDLIGLRLMASFLNRLEDHNV